MEPIGTLIYANGIGDHLVTLPAVRALSRLLEGRLRLVTAPEVARLFYRDVSVGEVAAIPFSGEPGGGKRFDAEWAARRIGRCPLLVSLNPWHSRSMDELLRLVRPEASIGLDPAFDAYVPLDFSLHSADMAFSLVRALDPSLRIDEFSGPPDLDAEARRKGRALVTGLPQGFRAIAVHADTQPWKEWRPEHFRAALHGFLDRRPDYVAFVLGSRDLGLDQGPHGARVLPAIGLSLHASMAVVEASDLFLGVDSCLLHAADLFRTPGVALFGATSAAEWGFRFARHAHMDCGPKMDRDRIRRVIASLEELHRGDPNRGRGMNAQADSFASRKSVPTG